MSAADKYDNIMRDAKLEECERARLASEITVDGATFEQLSLTMTHVAAHADPAVSMQPLCDNGEHIEVSYNLWNKTFLFVTDKVMWSIMAIR